MPESALQPLAGFFGKLPARGDFISRHLPKLFLDPWDTWLQMAITESRAQLAEAWREYYCTSPLWCFALSPGCCGPTAYAGILMPSVDRVGRYYPLMIAAPLAPDWPLLSAPLAADPWFRQAEQLALASLALDQLDLELFSQQVAALGTPLPPSSGDPGVAYSWPCPLPNDSSMLTAFIPALASDLSPQQMAQMSIWWTEGSEQITRCLLLCPGLPPVSGFGALLAGHWQHWGWIEKQFAVSAAPCWGVRTSTEDL